MASVIVSPRTSNTKSKPSNTPKVITSVYNYQNGKSLKVDRPDGGFKTELFNAGPAKVSLLFRTDKDGDHCLMSCLKFLEGTDMYQDALNSMEEFIRQYRAYMS